MGLFGPQVRKIFQNLEKESFFINEVENPLFDIEKYIKSSENSLIHHLNKRIEEEDKRIEFEEKNYPEDEITGPSPDYYSNIEVKNLHYISIFTFLYSFLERKMKKLSDGAGNKYKRKTEESYILGFRKNLELFQVDFQGMQSEWDYFNSEKCQKLRNKLAHDNEIYEEIFPISDNKILIEFIKNIKIFLGKIYYENFED